MSNNQSSDIKLISLLRHALRHLYDPAELARKLLYGTHYRPPFFTYSLIDQLRIRPTPQIWGCEAVPIICWFGSVISVMILVGPSEIVRSVSDASEHPANS